MRWEMRTRLFLRTAEFLWQEGHTMHATAEEAIFETEQMLNIYSSFAEEFLAIPVIKGKKTDKEKFAGAEATYTMEAMMHDGKALQSATSHYFGDGFAKAFGVEFTDKDNTLKNPHETSWGISTRIIGGLIMVHGDDNGLVLPPMIAPIQLMVIPVMQHKEGVIEKAQEVLGTISKFCRAKIDISDKTPGWKFSECEMKGIPLRLELGPKDIENNKCVLVRRDTREKYFVSLDELETKIPEILSDIQSSLYNKAKESLYSRIYDATTIEQAKDIADNKPGFMRAMWCGERECEDMLKEKAGVSSRCIPFEGEERISDTCVCCGKKAKNMLYWGKAY
jgi:prolyl-tRNA synthetase